MNIINAFFKLKIFIFMIFFHRKLSKKPTKTQTKLLILNLKIKLILKNLILNQVKQTLESFFLDLIIYQTDYIQKYLYFLIKFFLLFKQNYFQVLLFQFYFPLIHIKSFLVTLFHLIFCILNLKQL
jgi:hypothetical protein